MDALQSIILLVVSVFAGMYGSLAGGPSLVTIPTLIFFNISPLVAIASNRVGIIGLTISGWYKFHQMRNINYRLAWLLVVPMVIGSYFGAEFILNIDEGSIEKLVAIFTFILLGIMVINPRIGLTEIRGKISLIQYALGIPLALVVGFYGGFYGAGVGTFTAYILILLFGQTFLRSAGTNKIPLFFVSVITAIMFIFAGVVQFWIAAIIFAGTFIGAYIGAAYSEKLGNKYLKWMFISVAAIMALELLF